MADIVIAEFMDDASVASLKEDFGVVYDAALVDDPERLAREAADCRALIVRNRTQVRGALLDAAGNLEIVGRLGVGLDNIDVDACKARGITVQPATGANDLSVAEYVVASALMLVRGAYFSRAAMMAGAWPRQALIGGEVSGRVMGLIGCGAIAREVAIRARDLGMDVVAHDPFVPASDAIWQSGIGRRESLDDLLAEADVISLHIPLTDGTRHLVNAATLALVKPSAVLINAARGGVVDEASLAEALRSGSLAGAALDVFETEPLTAEAARIFEGIDNLILTPHVAGVTTESNVRVGRMIAEKVAAHLRR